MKPISIESNLRTGLRTLRTALTIALIGLSLMLPALASAAPVRPAARNAAFFDTPSWLSEGSAASLNIGVDVLVPSDPPAPFSGEPAISASDGYYNLYWLIGGSPPTFLSITGQAGGSIPAYSKYDRNVELTVNASVNGSDAYHDVTPIYDLVYWQVGGVVYSVESHNMTGTDSLSLAESLVTLTPLVAVDPTPADTPTPASDSNASGTGGNGTGGNASVPPTATETSGNASAAGNATGTDPASTDTPSPDAPGDAGNGSAQSASSGNASLTVPVVIDAGGSGLVTVSGSNGDTLKVDAGSFTATGRDSIIDVADADLEWEAPSPDANQTVTFELVNGNAGKVITSAQTIVSIDPTAALVCPASAASAKDAAIVLRGSGLLTVKTDTGAFPANGINADFSSNGGKTTISGTIPAAGQVKLDWKAPERNSDGTANFTVTDENSATIGTCAIKVTKTAAKSTATPKPAAKAAAQKSDGTDLTVTGPGKVNAEPSVIASASGGIVDDGSGILAPVTPKPGSASAPTPIATKAAPAATKTTTPSVKPSATLAPTLDTSGMVSQVIGPDGGRLSCPTGATIIIPAGALAQLATVTLRPVASSKLPAGSSVDILPGTAFDITVAAMDGKSIDGLSKPAQFSVALASDKWRSGTTLYAVDGLELAPLSNVTLHGDSVSAPVDKLNRYVAGVPVKAVASAKRSVAKLVMAGAALVFFVSVAALAFKLWLGRKTTMTVGPRRLR